MIFTKNTYYRPLLSLALSAFTLTIAAIATGKGEKERQKELPGCFRQAITPLDQIFPITAASLYNLAI
jgi:hypothetical protein